MGLRCGPLERIVRDRFGNIYCKACKPCPAGEETTPPCNIDQLYDEDSLINERCKVCDDGYFKEVTERERNNTKECHQCGTCGNRVVESPCNKTHGKICGKKCKHGYVDSGFGTCISSSKSEPPVIASNPSVSPEATQKPRTTKRVEEPTKKNKPVSHHSLAPQSTVHTLIKTQNNEGITQGLCICKDNSCGSWKKATIGLIIVCVVLFLALLGVCFTFWKKTKKRKRTKRNGPQTHHSERAILLNESTRASQQDNTDNVQQDNTDNVQQADTDNVQQTSIDDHRSTNSTQARNVQQANTDNHRYTSFTDQLRNGNIGEEIPDDVCCYCGEWAGESLDKVPRIKQKFCDLAKHFKHEKEVCNKLFNTLKGEECENNRINTTEDLYEKLYAEIPNLIVAKFLKAFQTIGFHGILEKIHDTFHHSPNLV